MPVRWTRAVLRHRVLVLALWLAVLAAGALAAARLPGMLATSFAVPGTGSERARVLLADRFGERTDGAFTVVFPGVSREAARGRLERAAEAVPGARAGEVVSTGGIAFGDVRTRLDLAGAKRWTDAVRAAAGPGALVTGQAAIQRDLDPIFASDLRRGQAIAIPAALLVLALLLGISLALAVPFAVAASTIAATLAGLWGLAHLLPTVSYVTNLVELLGLGLAIDYALLLVHRQREELERGGSVEDAVVRTMATAGRAVAFSGAAVAAGLALLLLMPVPFIRSLGAAGCLVALASIAAAATLQPVLLSLLGRRIGRPRPADSGIWGRLARTVMRRPVAFLAGGSVVLLAAAAPALGLRLTPVSLTGLPAGAESVRGFVALRDAAGPGAPTPTQVVVDGNGPAARAAAARLVDALVADPETIVVASGRRPPYAAPGATRIVVVGRHDYAAPETRALVRRLRDRLVPAAGFPGGVRVEVGGVPAEGVDFLGRTYGAFPWLVGGVLALTFLVLLRAFRSVLLPLKAIVLNALTVAAVYGLLVLVFQVALGRGRIDGWVPVVLYATLFGLSMDYEVFVVARMREAWDAGRSNAEAVVEGLQRSGRVVTAAAAIMVAALAGLGAGRVESLQEFGVGLAVAVALDATLVRAVLVPAAMAVLGRWNWWLPAPLGRLRVAGRLDQVTLLGPRVGHEELAVRALEAVVTRGRAHHQRCRERLLAVGAGDLERLSGVREVGHDPKLAAARRPAARNFFYSSTRSIAIACTGLSRASVSALEIRSTTSIPEVTRPKTVCLPSSQGQASAVTMKNWLPFVFGPAFAIASAPRSTGWSLNSSSNV